jgi:IclR family KDG regulon transcriptional repressor
MEHNAIEKALLVLSNFENGNQPIGTVELAERLGLNKTTVSRIVNTLKRHNYLEQDPRTRQYGLGPKIATLGKAIIQSLDGQISIMAQPYCDRLRDQVAETVHLEVLSGNHFYLSYAVRGPNPVSVAINVGDRVYCNVHAGAKAITAFSDPEQFDAYLKNHLAVYTPKSVTDTAKLIEMYGKIRERGYSIDDGEYDNNIYAIGAPIFDHNNRAVAAVVIVAPYMRKKELERAHIVRFLKEAATLISGRLLCQKDYQEICNSRLAKANA